MRFYSQCLSGQTNFSFVLPNEIPPDRVKDNPHFARPAKNLYLLHGYSGNDEDWEFNGVAEDLSSEYNLNVFMIYGANEFYLDRAATGRKYCTYAGKEIIEYTRKTFGLSNRREDTMVGGLSMGGFGALHTGLAWPETFGGIIALSSALIIPDIAGLKPGSKSGDIMANYEYYREVFGDLDQVEKSDANPEVLYDKLAKEGRGIPPIYMAIGTEDGLYRNNQIMRKFLEDRHADFRYEEGPCIHDWKFWNHYVHNGVKWLLEKNGGC